MWEKIVCEELFACLGDNCLHAAACCRRLFACGRNCLYESDCCKRLLVCCKNLFVRWCVHSSAQKIQFLHAYSAFYKTLKPTCNFLPFANSLIQHTAAHNPSCPTPKQSSTTHRCTLGVFFNTQAIFCNARRCDQPIFLKSPIPTRLHAVAAKKAGG